VLARALHGLEPDEAFCAALQTATGGNPLFVGAVLDAVAWRRARQAAFTAEVAASPLAKTPYDLRHAAVSTWLNGGVPPTTVAEWAGHSVDVLLRIYAKCLDGGDALIRQRVQAALGYADTDLS
jgi:integrase